MTRYRSLTAGVLVAAVLAGGAAYAQDGGRGGPGGRGRGVMGAHGLALRGLNLTEAQQEQVRGIRERNRDAIRQAEQRVRDAMLAQRKAAEAIPVNEGQIRATTFAIAEAQTEVAILQARLNSDIWSLLTAEQQEQVNRMRATREERLQQRRALQP